MNFNTWPNRHLSHFFTPSTVNLIRQIRKMEKLVCLYFFNLNSSHPHLLETLRNWTKSLWGCRNQDERLIFSLRTDQRFHAQNKPNVANRQKGSRQRKRSRTVWMICWKEVNRQSDPIDYPSTEITFIHFPFGCSGEQRYILIYRYKKRSSLLYSDVWKHCLEANCVLRGMILWVQKPTTRCFLH